MEPPPAATAPTASRPSGRTGPFDGGAVLLSRPYAEAQWADVRGAWWWHTVGMVLLLPFYSLVAFTVWQEPSRQSLLRRIIWSTAITLSACLIVGIPAFVVFSRRWYWLYRSKVDPEAAGVGEREPDANRGYMDWAAVGGKLLADRLTGEAKPPPPGTPELGEPWAGLLADAVQAVTRVAWARSRATGPAAVSIEHAYGEAVSAQQAVSKAAFKGFDVDQARHTMDADGIRTRLVALDSKPGTAEDLDAARRSLREQLATVERMTDVSGRLEGQLLRMVAQLGEAAARAEELSLCPPGTTVVTGDLTDAVDGLAAIRSALEAVEIPLPPTTRPAITPGT